MSDESDARLGVREKLIKQMEDLEREKKNRTPSGYQKKYHIKAVDPYRMDGLDGKEMDHHAKKVDFDKYFEEQFYKHRKEVDDFYDRHPELGSSKKWKKMS